MKRLVLAALAMVAAPGASQAQGMPPEPVPVWAGFYLGANAGILQSDDGTIAGSPGGVQGRWGGGFVPTPVVRGADGKTSGTTALIGGGQFGYNLQTGSIVWGVEADLQVMSATRDERRVGGSPSGRFPVFGGVSERHGYDYLGTVRARVGYLVLPDLLVFATGGLAYGERSTSIRLETPGVVASLSRSAVKTGYTVGGGIEYALDQNWSVKGEGLYYDLGKSRSSGALTDTSPLGNQGVLGEVHATSRDRGVIGRVGLNYRFAGW